MSKWLWTAIIVLSLGCVALQGCSNELYGSAEDVAIVNGSAITKAAFDKEMVRAQRQLARMGRHVSVDQQADFENDVLESLIATELLFQESKKQGIEITDAEAVKHLTSVKTQFPDEAEFKAAITEAGLSEDDIKMEFRRGRAIEQLIDKQVAQKVSVSNEESKGYYDSNPGLFVRPEQVRASHILVRVDPMAGPAEKEKAREQLESVQKKLEEGEDFAALAKETSQCPSAEKGGDLGFFPRGQMVAPFEQAAFVLDTGETSDIVETQFGYHLIKVTEKEAETVLGYEQVKDQIKQYLEQDKVRKELSQYIKELKANAIVERLLSKETTQPEPAP